MKFVRLSQVLAGVLLVAAVAALVSVIVSGPATLTLFTLNEGGTGMTIGLYLDLLSVTLLAFVASIALIVATYSARNLRGQERLARFGLLLSASFLTLAVMVTGASLPVIAFGWTVSGLLLAALVAHRDSHSAQRAGRAVRRTLLIGDVALWSGVVLAAVALPSLDRTALAAATPSLALTAAALALGAAAIVRSALVPAWGWLPLTAEAPSPVSAYLHAGIVNGAAVLVALVWPVFALVPLVLGLFIAVGAATVVIATVAGKQRPDVKGQLAASTSAQMGYMTIQLGLGLPAAAVLHLIGHGYYKAWMFLRAGGAVTRRRTETAAPELSRPEQLAGIGLSVLAAAGVIALVMPRMVDTLGLFGPAGLFPVIAAGGTAAVAVYALWARASLARWRATLSGLMLTLALLAGYLVVLTSWDNALAAILPEAPVWPTAAAIAWLVALGAAAVIMVIGVRAAARRPDGRLGVAALATALPRAARGRGAVLPAAPDALPADPQLARDLVSAAAQLVSPAFPLRSVVAANPLAGLEELPFLDAARVAERTWGARAFLPESQYVRLWDEGRITAADLERVLADYVADGSVIDSDEVRRELLERARGEATAPTSTPVPVLAERNTPSGEWTPADIAAAHDALWTARVWGAAAPPADGVLWRRWCAAAAAGWGADLGLAALAADLSDDAATAVAQLLQRSQVSPTEWFEYVGRLLTRAPGWAAHAAWRRRAGLSDAVIELVAVRMAHDLAVGGPAPADGVPAQRVEEPVVALADPLVRRRIWQSALEENGRRDLVAQVVDAAGTVAIRPERTHEAAAQIVLCIDVRSERFRRHLERAGAVETFGFAGFFGAAVRYTSEFGHDLDQCPVLLSPTHRVEARPHVTDSAVYAGRRTISSAWTTPGSAFALAEGTGVLAGAMAAMHTFAPATTTKWGHAGAPAQWHPAADLADVERTADPAPGELPVGFAIEELVELAHSALHAIGLTSGFAPLLVIAGHGATVQNNAFAAAYDCGACGGNAGLDNARILVHALNHPLVRRSLTLRGIEIPAETVAVAALHDTTTDDLIMDGDQLPAGPARDAFAHMTATARRAAGTSALERMADLPGAPVTQDPAAARRHVHRRAGDWAEACPEWGLAGNAAFVIGPRALTEQLDLGGRVFLHSYEPDQDTDAAVLQTILTAPVVVAQWINSQYYFSTVDAAHFGSGDKSTHNVIGDIGVITGAHGDLQVGLPWQALFAEESAAESGVGRHLPVRLSVVAYADEARILDIVAGNQGLRNLVTNEWISITAIDPTSGRERRLHPALRWVSEPVHWESPAPAQQQATPLPASAVSERPAEAA